jgi:predicted neutral ceramidase superfamily lipid hydrolase
MAAIHCLHCQAENDPIFTAGHCCQCGQSLPAIRANAAAVAPKEDSPETKAAKSQASGILFFIAAVQVICGSIGLGLIVAAGDTEQMPQNLLLAAVGELIAYTVLFSLLGLMARWLPLTASLIGLLIYVSACLIQFALAPELIAQVIIIKLAMGAAIGRAVFASAKALRS